MGHRASLYLLLFTILLPTVHNVIAYHLQLNYPSMANILFTMLLPAGNKVITYCSQSYCLLVTKLPPTVHKVSTHRLQYLKLTLCSRLEQKVEHQLELVW